MELFRNRSAATYPEAAGSISLLYWVLGLLSLVPLGIVLPMASTGTGVAIIASWIALIWVAISFARRRFDYIALLWLALYPYCYYLFSFPRERSIFTIDRAFIFLVVVEMLVFSRQGMGVSLTHDIRVSAYCWGLYIMICFLSLSGHPLTEALPSYRMLADGIVMPALLGLYAIRYFPMREDLQKLHVCACILGLGLFVTGFIELVAGVDLFPWSGAEPVFTDTGVRRADGPFEQQEVLAMVAMLVFILIVYLRRLMPDRVSPWRAVLHRAGAMASFGAALIPLNRGLVLVLAPIAMIDVCSKHRLIPRRAWLSIFGMLVFAVVALKLHDPRLYDDRVSRPDNFYQRIAQHRETLQVVREYPFFGVGFYRYHDVASRNPRYMAKWKGIESMTFAHNVVMTVLSEEGIVGLICYIAAQVFLIRAMWRIRKAYAPGWLAFLYCLLVYVLIGLDYGTVYFADINLLYIFILGVLFQFQSRMAQAQGAGTPMSLNQDLPVQVG